MDSELALIVSSCSDSGLGKPQLRGYATVQAILVKVLSLLRGLTELYGVIALLFFLGSELGNALGAYAVAEVSAGVRQNVGLQLDPASGWRPNSLAPGANGEKSLERPHFSHRFP